MKTLVTVLMTTFVSMVAHADDLRTYKKTDANTAQVKIETEDPNYTQAAAYVDGQELNVFIQDLLKDPNSELAKIKAKIEQDTCETNSTPNNPWIEFCGQVELTEPVRTSFGRGGWMEGAAQYTVFVGFRSDGTGHFYDVSHMITLSESAVAEVKEDTGDYAGVVTKTYRYVKATVLPKDN